MLAAHLGLHPRTRQQHPSKSAPARRAAAVNHHQLAAPPIKAQLSAQRLNAPQISDPKPRERAFFSFHHHKRSSSHHSGREFYYRVFLPSSINDSESLLRKECTGTGHQPSDVGVSAAFLSIRVRREKGFQIRCRCRRTEISLSTEQTHSAEGYLAKRQLSSD